MPMINTMKVKMIVRLNNKLLCLGSNNPFPRVVLENKQLQHDLTQNVSNSFEPDVNV